MKTFYTRYILAVVLVGILIFFTLTACESKKNTVVVEASSKPITKDITTDKPPAPKAQTAELRVNDDLSRVINTMSDELDNVQVTGNYDIDLVRMMSIHSHASVDLINHQLRNGRDAELKVISEKMLKSSKLEMADLIGLVRDFRLKPGYEKDTIISEKQKKRSAELYISMRSIVDSMQMKKSSGDLDSDFVSVMLPYHKGVINVSEDASKQTKNQQVKKLSRNMSSAKTEELKELKTWMKKTNRKSEKVAKK